MRRYSVFAFVILFVGLFVQIAPGNANENDIFVRFKKPMPEIPELPESDFITQTRPVKDVPYNQEALGYSLRVPKNWTASEKTSSSNFSLSDKLFLELSSFYGKASPFGRSRIEIQALSLETNLTIEQWYIKHILDEGLTTEGFIVHDPDKIESLMVIMEGDSSYYLRTLVTRNENKVIMMKYYVPTNLMQNEAGMQQAVIASFKMISNIPQKDIQSKVYRFLDIAELRYPEGWKVFASPLRSVDYMDTSLVNVGKESSSSNFLSKGKIDVTLILSANDTTLIEAIASYKKKIELSGILIGKKTSGYGEFSYHEEMDFSISEVYMGVDSTNNQSEYEFWFSVLVGGNYYYFITLVTPSRNENFPVWAKNIQNYHYILENFKPMSGAFLSRN